GDGARPPAHPGARHDPLTSSPSWEACFQARLRPDAVVGRRDSAPLILPTPSHPSTPVSGDRTRYRVPFDPRGRQATISTWVPRFRLPMDLSPASSVSVTRATENVTYTRRPTANNVPLAGVAGRELARKENAIVPTTDDP